MQEKIPKNIVVVDAFAGVSGYCFHAKISPKGL
jgi:hypothetical protein